MSQKEGAGKISNPLKILKTRLKAVIRLSLITPTRHTFRENQTK